MMSAIDSYVKLVMVQSQKSQPEPQRANQNHAKTTRVDQSKRKMDRIIARASQSRPEPDKRQLEQGFLVVTRKGLSKDQDIEDAQEKSR